MRLRTGRRRPNAGGSTPGDTLAQQTARRLAQGHRPEPILAPPMRLRDGERCFAHTPVQLLRCMADDSRLPTHLSGWGIGWSGLLLFSGSGRARRAAQPPSFRVVDWGELFLTDHRVAVQGARSWTDLWFGDIRAAGVADDTIELHVAGGPPTRLWIGTPGEYFVVFWWLWTGGQLPFTVQETPAGNG